MGLVATWALAQLVTGCAPESVVVTAPEAGALRPRRLFVLLAVGEDVSLAPPLSTSTAWRELAAELQVRGFDFVAVSRPRRRATEEREEPLSVAIADELRGVEVAAYDEVIVVASPAGTCAWSTLLRDGAFGSDFEPDRTSLHVVLVPAWSRRGARRGERATAATSSCSDLITPAKGPARHLVIHLEGRTGREDEPRDPWTAGPSNEPTTLRAALDHRAFGPDLVLLVDELFSVRETGAVPALDLRKITR